MRKPLLTYERKRRWVGYAFLSPWLVGVVFFFLIPLFQSFVYSVSDIKLAPGGVQSTYIGFERFDELFRSDPYAMRYLIDSLRDIAIQTLFIGILSIFIAMVLNQQFRGRLFMRAVFFLPVIVTSGIVISIIKGDTTISELVSTSGKSSTLVQSFELLKVLQGIGFPQEITDFVKRNVDRILNLAWVSGVQILILLAGLQTIPASLKEAARIDGASSWEYFCFVTLPLISPMLLLTTVYSIIDGLSDFSNPYQGYIIEKATKYLNYSLSSALSTVYLAVVLAGVGLLLLATRRRVFYMVD